MAAAGFGGRAVRSTSSRDALSLRPFATGCSGLSTESPGASSTHRSPAMLARMGETQGSRSGSASPVAAASNERRAAKLLPLTGDPQLLSNSLSVSIFVLVRLLGPRASLGCSSSRDALGLRPREKLVSNWASSARPPKGEPAIGALVSARESRIGETLWPEDNMVDN